jgi:hypothetical protein
MRNSLRLLSALLIGHMISFAAEPRDLAVAASAGSGAASAGARGGHGKADEGGGEGASPGGASGASAGSASPTGGHVMDYFFASGSARSKQPSGYNGLLNRFRDYVFGRDTRADESRSEMQRQQNLAREAVSRGQIQPLEAIMRNVRNAVHGELLSARLERDDAGAWTYRLVVLADNGRYHRILVDAGRNVILKVTP